MTAAGPFRARALFGIAAALLAGGVVRAMQFGHGLPEFQEEAWPFREAWAMWGWDSGRLDLNPHRFHYPSLTFYLHFLLQQAQYLLGLAGGAWQSRADFFLAYQVDPGALVVAARAMGAAIELAGIAALVWLGERLRPGAGMLAGVGAAISITMIHAVRAIVPDTAMAAFAMFALLAMLAHLRTGGRRELTASVVAIGLATGAKYPAALLLVPLAAVLVMRDARRAPLSWVFAAAGAFGVFLVTTPFALLDLQTFWRDLGFVRQLPAAGHLGRLEGTGALASAAALLQNVGPLGALLLPVSLGLVLARWRERRAEFVLWIALLAFALPVFTARIEADRYLVPVIPVALLLASLALVDLVARTRGALRTGLAAIAGIALLAPIWFGAGDRTAPQTESTRTAAARWFEANAAPGEIIVQEAYGATLHTRMRAYELLGHPLYAAASPAAQARVAAVPAFRAVQLPLTTVGPGTVIVPDAHGREVTVALADHSVAFNALSYDPRLFADVDWIVTTDAVRGRFMVDTVRFAAEAAFYRRLDSTTAIAAAFAPGAGLSGPAIRIHRATPAFRAAVAAPGGLDPLWWAEAIPMEGRLRLEAAALPAEARTGGAVRTAAGAPAPWVLRLSAMYANLVRPLAHPLSVYHAEVGHAESARRLAAATLEVVPDDVEACLVFTTACALDRAWLLARRAIERTLAALDGEAPAVLQIEYARILEETGDRDRARSILEGLAGGPDPAAAEAARARLGAMEE